MLAWRIAARVVAVARAVHYAHQRGIQLGDDPDVGRPFQKQSKAHADYGVIIHKHHADIPDCQFALHSDSFH